METLDNRTMNWIAVIEIVLAVLLTQADFLMRILGTTQLDRGQFGLALLPVVGLFGLWEIGKLIARRRGRAITPRETKSSKPTNQSEMREMSKEKTKTKKQHEDAGAAADPPSAADEVEARPAAKMRRKEYEREMRRLHGELVALQEWVKATGAKICIVFEGRDTAGKGGTIKRITERVSPRVFRVVALPAPTEREKSQMYIQRYIQHFPAAREVVIFDRSWYNRAGVERVMGFCSEEQTTRFLELVPQVEKAMVDSGIVLLKYWLEVDPDEQTRRLESRIDDPRKIWKLSRHGPEVLHPLVRLLACPRRHVPGERHRLGALVRREQQRQEARPAQHHHPPAQPDPLRAARTTRTSSCRSDRSPTATVSPTWRCGTSRPRSEARDRNVAGRSRRWLREFLQAPCARSSGRFGAESLKVACKARCSTRLDSRSPMPRCASGRSARAWPSRPLCPSERAAPPPSSQGSRPAEPSALP